MKIRCKGAGILLPTILSAEDQAGVDAAEAEGVAEHELRVGRPTVSGEVLEIAGGIGLPQVYGRREPASLAGQGADAGLERATRAKRIVRLRDGVICADERLRA